MYITQQSTTFAASERIETVQPDGEAIVLTTGLRELLKLVSTNIPTKKRRTELGIRDKKGFTDQFFDHVILIAQLDRLHVTYWTIDDDEMVKCSLVAFARAIVRQPFKASVNVNTLKLVAKYLDDERVTLLLIGDTLHINQPTNRTRLPHKPEYLWNGVER